MTPIVLHHGLFGFGGFDIGRFHLSYFRGIDQAIIRRGHPLIVSRVHPTGSIRRRAIQLKRIIRRQLELIGRGGQRVVIVAHSMGGLDARYMISRLGMADRVAALVTICTPHRGSPYADWCLLNIGRRLGGLQLMRLLNLDVAGVSDLTLASCRRFNELVPNVPTVRYVSISAARPWHQIPAFAMHAWRVIHDCEGENDGLVSVRSAAWGEHLATWPADHFLTVNRRFVLKMNAIPTDVTPRYMAVLDHLAAAGLLE